MKAQQIEGDLWDFGTVAASSGNDRLCLRYIGEDRFDFHELVWERKVNDQWMRHKTITAQAF